MCVTGAGRSGEELLTRRLSLRRPARHLPGQAVIARVRPQNAASRRIVVKAGLSRAEHLDRPGEDGDDCLYVSPRPGAIMPL